MIRPLQVGEERDLGVMMPGVSNEPVRAKAISTQDGPNGEVTLVDLTYAGINLGQALIGNNAEIIDDVTSWSWTWN